MQIDELERRAASGETDAQLALAKVLDREPRDASRNAKMLHLLTEAASNGRAEAQYLLAMKLSGLIDEGHQDTQAIFQWFKNSAEQNYLPAIYELANCYERGIGVQRNIENAIRLFETAASRGDSESAFRLYTMHSAGDVAGLIPDEHVRWLTEAADHGHTGAALALANSYINGIGVTTDHKEALRWLNRAAESNDASAHSFLAIVYEKGMLGVTRNKLTATTHRKRALELGNKESLELRSVLDSMKNAGS